MDFLLSGLELNNPQIIPLISYISSKISGVVLKTEIFSDCTIITYILITSLHTT